MTAKLIYDVGMNNGDDTAYYLHRGFNVLAIEADPTLCSKASLRFKNEIKEGRLTILNIGIAPVQGELDFWICDGLSVWNSFHKHIASRDGLPHHSIKIKCQTFRWVLENYGIPHYLKIDIEGNEYLCIEGLTPSADPPKYVSCELDDMDKCLHALDALGFSKYKLISQFNFLPWEIPPSKEQRRYEIETQIATSRNPFARVLRKGLRVIGKERWITQMRDRLRRNSGWTFPWGSTGPFGEDLPGQWHSSQEVRHIYESFQNLFRQGVKSSFWDVKKDYSFWVDLHACRED
ncbi:MAG: FkbM family methyltransferase [Methylacidiphilales bacterium]|nr:FkbM family methyltransferase [Candidatus Methylacidiphilales bacterium]